VWERVWALIAEMAQACQQNGIRFLVVAFPTAFQLNSAGHPDLPQRVMTRRAAAADIDFADLLPTYQRVCDSAPSGACEGYENLLFADVWMHPNSLGHQLAAKVLSTRLMRLVNSHQ